MQRTIVSRQARRQNPSLTVGYTRWVISFRMSDRLTQAYTPPIINFHKGLTYRRA
ncbi:hypothetical protein B0J17DRAFT_656906 [Rhizoctonia solani]|nr:hypothetical protein B0J17DRAFT_656906 [Rhizoctonia solani]